MKKMLSFHLVGMLVVTFLLNLPIMSIAQCPWVARAGAPGGPCYFYSSIPNLTTEQQTSIDALRTEYWKALDKKQSALVENRQTLRQLRAEKDVDIKRVNKLIDEINEQEAEITKRQVKYREDVRQLLTEEQKAAFDNLGNRAVPVRGIRPGRGLGPCGRLNG